MKIIDLEEKDINQEPGTEGMITTAAVGVTNGASGVGILAAAIGVGQTIALNKVLSKLKKDAPIQEVTNDKISEIKKVMTNKKVIKDFENAFNKALEEKFGKSFFDIIGKEFNRSLTAVSFKLVKLKNEDGQIFTAKIPIAKGAKLFRMSTIFSRKKKSEQEAISETGAKGLFKNKQAVLNIVLEAANKALNEVPEMKNLSIPISFGLTANCSTLVMVTPKLKVVSSGNESLDLEAIFFEEEKFETVTESEYVVDMFKDMGIEDIEIMAKILKGDQDALESLIDISYDDILPDVAIESINEIIEEEGTEGLVKWIKDKAQSFSKVKADTVTEMTDEDIEKAEATFGKYPTEFLKEISKVNGARFNGKYEVNGKLLKKYLDIKEGATDSIFMFNGKDGLVGKMTPFAITEFGDVFGFKDGKVCFWDHETDSITEVASSYKDWKKKLVKSKAE